MSNQHESIGKAVLRIPLLSLGEYVKLKYIFVVREAFGSDSLYYDVSLRKPISTLLISTFLIL